MRKMRKPLVTLAAVVMVLGLGASAEAKPGGNFGAGVQLGFPGNGLSFNYFMGNAASIQVDATLWLNGDWTGLGARVDLLWWQTPLAKLSFADLVWYFGPGVNVFSFSWGGKESKDAYIGLGAEFPVGIGFQFTGAPIDLNLEAVPILHILGSNGTNVDFGIAGVLNARYYF